MDLGLAERVVLVTGSSKGIGRATAELFAKEGARVAITYKNDHEAAERVARGIVDRGGEAVVVPLDLTDDASIAAAVDSVLSCWKRVDVLVNNAVQWGARSVGEAPPFEKLPSDEWRAMLRANLEGHFAVTQAVLPSMRERRWGRIVNVSSGLAVNGMPGSTAYSAAKAGLHGMTRALYKELGPSNVLVNVVMAGATLTDHFKKAVPQPVQDRLAQSSPLGRLPRPEEVAPTIVFLGSAANATVNGEIVLSSGGHA